MYATEARQDEDHDEDLELGFEDEQDDDRSIIINVTRGICSIQKKYI